MIQIFHGARAPGTNAILDAMHRDRKLVFVDLLKWDVPVIDDCFEIDQFDDERAIYLVAVDGDGAHRGSIRLLPTDGPHILGTIFPDLCDGGVPRSLNIYEISRGCLSMRLRAPERLAVRNALTTAAVEFALLHEIHAFTCIADSGWLSQVLALGWDCWPLGLPRKIGRSLTGALRIDITPETPHLLREAGTYVSAPLTLAEAGARVLA
ncbi:autoinducer synthase [Novosphingobium sp. NBM11]|uniref:acyl-homoserine-lactone synthase n=1 Tax=Novosphingobium sp. NBM11 TaxID=2596914 RepID=UPI001891FCE7|nr:acyl-homoserine-lactone synthase [Novosphingobium sp. NBM11]MBF5089102.1 autoinducer synthase [Novosphingobium sp. NBM11]